MANIVWKHISSGENLSKDDVIEALGQKTNGIVVLSAPSNAGKTTLLMHLRRFAKTPMMMYSYQDAVDSIVSQAKAHRLDEGVPFFDNHPAGAILGIEDIDYLCGRENTRHILYEQVKRLSGNSLVILTGIDIELRMGDIFQHLPDADWFYAISLYEDLEFWDLYYENGVKIPSAFHVRGKPIPEGCYHLVVNVLIRDRQGKYLLGQRSADRKSFPLMWEGAGGSALMGETALEAGIREAYEELGIRLNPNDAKLIDTQVRKIGRNGKPYRDILKTYLFELDEIIWFPDAAPTKEEVVDSRLYTFSEIRELYQTGQLNPDLDYIFDLIA